MSNNARTTLVHPIVSACEAPSSPQIPIPILTHTPQHRCLSPAMLPGELEERMAKKRYLEACPLDDGEVAAEAPRRGL